MKIADKLKKFNKPTTGRADLVLMVIIVIGLLAVVNFFSYQIFYRWDLTQNKDYSISSVSKKTVKSLDDIVKIKAYFSQELPSQYIGLRQEIGDILDEYENYSNGKIKYEFIDPKDNKELEQELFRLGVPQLQFNVLEKDKYQVVNGYLGMVIGYGDKNQIIPVIQDTVNLEYQITSAIKKLTAKEAPVIGFVSSNGSLDSEKEISQAYKGLSELYDLRQVNLAAVLTVPAEIKTLIIAGPKEKFSEDELKAVDAFVMRGGSLLLLLDGVRVGEGLIAQTNDLGLDKLLENYGLKLNHDLVLDFSSGVASFTQGFVTFTLNYPFWPKILKGGFDQNNVAVAKLESVVLPWPSSLEITGKEASGNKVSYLVKTTKRAWRQTDNFNLNPQQAFNQGNEASQYNLALALFGKLNSAYNQGSTENGRLIIVGDSNFIRDNFLTGAGDNLIFFQNLVDSLTLAEDLINIRSKGISDRPLKELSDKSKLAVRYLNIFGLTVIIVAFGLSRYYLRRRSSLVDEI